jgi:hypothetical protein
VAVAAILQLDALKFAHSGGEDITAPQVSGDPIAMRHLLRNTIEEMQGYVGTLHHIFEEEIGQHSIYTRTTRCGKIKTVA